MYCRVKKKEGRIVPLVVSLSGAYQCFKVERGTAQHPPVSLPL
jgi:hypothetical protein